MRVRINSSGPPTEEALRTVGAVLIGVIERIEARKRDEQRDARETA